MVFDKNIIAQDHRTAKANVPNIKGIRLIEGGDCKACHSVDKKSIGHAYRDMSLEYKEKAGIPFPYIEVSLKADQLMIDAGGQIGEIKPTREPHQFDASDKAMITTICLLAS